MVFVKGYKQTETHKRKHIDKIKGSGNGNWAGGSATFKARRKIVARNSYLKRKKRVVGSFTLGEWENLKAQYGFCCPSCFREEPQIKLTIDHIVPISKGGSNFIANIQPLCHSCNCKKHTKIIKYPL